MVKDIDPRELAYIALIDERFISDVFAERREQVKIDPLTQEIAYGTCRMQRALDHLALQLSHKKQLKLKRKERWLLRMALYQYYFMDKIPIHAIANESVILAKKYCHETFVKFLNAVLRQIPNTQFTLPDGDDVSSLSVRYSYPEEYIKDLINSYDLNGVKKILAAGNYPPVIMARNRKIGDVKQLMGPINEVSSSSDFYIQNITPVKLIHHLAEKFTSPRNILDLCAAPGGKLLAAYDCFPDADLYANDVTQKKIQRIEENLMKYHIQAKLDCQPGEIYSSNERFDLIILDVPCSNSGVFNKRPEARWRYDQNEHLYQLQWNLLKNAATLLSEHGEIWYLTCSILPKENSETTEKAVQQLSLKKRVEKLYLPNLEGWDGGYGCALHF